jgi:hypothetical protein
LLKTICLADGSFIRFGSIAASPSQRQQSALSINLLKYLADSIKTCLTQTLLKVIVTDKVFEMLRIGVIHTT